MSEYTETLAALAALPERLERRRAGFEQEIAVARQRREAEINAYATEHTAVVARLDETLRRAEAEGVEAGPADPGSDGLSSDPVQYAGQLVDRLEQALEHVLHTREALRSEEGRLGEEERRRGENERRRREAAAQSREQRWANAGEGSRWLAAALAIEALAGVVAGVAGSVAATLLIPFLAAGLGLLLAARLPSLVPAWAVWRASGTMPAMPAAAPRESRLALAAYAAASAAAAGLGAACTGSGAGALIGALGLLVIAAIWLVLPRQG